MFLYVSILISYSYHPQTTFQSLLTATVTVIYALPREFALDTSNQPSPHPCSWTSIDSFDVLLLTLLEESRGGHVGQCL